MDTWWFSQADSLRLFLPILFWDTNEMVFIQRSVPLRCSDYVTPAPTQYSQTPSVSVSFSLSLFVSLGFRTICDEYVWKGKSTVLMRTQILQSKNKFFQCLCFNITHSTQHRMTSNGGVSSDTGTKAQQSDNRNPLVLLYKHIPPKHSSHLPDIPVINACYCWASIKVMSLPIKLLKNNRFHRSGC